MQSFFNTEPFSFECWIFHTVKLLWLQQNLLFWFPSHFRSRICLKPALRTFGSSGRLFPPPFICLIYKMSRKSPVLSFKSLIGRWWSGLQGCSKCTHLCIKSDMKQLLQPAWRWTLDHLHSEETSEIAMMKSKPINFALTCQESIKIWISEARSLNVIV